MEDYNYKSHSDLFNRYYCIIENASDTELYYTGVSDFLRYKFKKLLTTINKENSQKILNINDIRFLETISIMNIKLLESKNIDDLTNPETKSQFNILLKTLFDGVNRFEREQFPCYNTGLMFRKLNELIQLLDEWGPIPDFWLKIKKYCKFKAVDIFKKLNAGEMPKTGGPKEEPTKNDIENRELYEWAKQENMDLNEINKSIYNQRNGSNNINTKDEDDKQLKEFVGFQRDKTNLFDEKNGKTQENGLSKKIIGERDKYLEEIGNEDTNNDLNMKENKIKRIKTEIISHSNKNPSIFLENQNDELHKVNPFINPKNNDLKQSKFMPETINNIFSNKQNTIDLNQKNYAFLNETVKPKLNKKPTPQKLNDIINDENGNEKIKITHKKEEENDLFYNKINQNINSERHRRLASQGVIGENTNTRNFLQNDNKRISTANSLFIDDFNNIQKPHKYSNNLDNKSDNSLYNIDSKNESENNDGILTKDKHFEDINKIDYKTTIKTEDDSHSFNNDANPDNLFYNITPNPNDHKPFVNRSVSIINYDNSSNMKLNNQISPEQMTFDNRTNNYNNINQSIGLNLANNQIYSEIPCVLGSGYKFNYDKYVNSSNKNQKQQDNYKNSQTKGKIKEKDDIEEMLNNLKRGNSKKIENINLDKNSLINKKHNLDADRKTSDTNKINKDENTLSLQNQEEKNNTELIKKISEKINSPEKVRLFANLKTKMLKNFNLKNYKNIPNFQLPLEYKAPEKKSKIKKYFIDLAKSSLQDIKRDDLSSTIKNLELLLFYFTNMKDK